jgi:hypothetical protein
VSGQLRSQGIAHLMWLTVMNHIHFVKNPYLDLEAEISFNAEGRMQFQSLRAVTFSQSGIWAVLPCLNKYRTNKYAHTGSICDCRKKCFFLFHYSIPAVARVLTSVAAIPEIEGKARSLKSRARAESLYHNHKSSFWTEEQNIELFIRRMTRGNFVDLLGKRLSAADLQALETVLFTISYPIVNLRYQF